MAISGLTRASFAASGIAGGLVANGVSFFLLIYYSQVLGLDPALAGLAMMVSLAFDAVTDPLVGHWSDRLRHRLGRRHPFLFASIVPIALAYYLLWDPPELGQTGLFLYLLGIAVAMRLALTLYLVPFAALLPEVAPDYDQRTRLLNYSYAGSWFFGTLMAVAMYAWWLADKPGEPVGSGVLRAEGYVDAGLVAAVIVLFCLALAAFGTRHHIPALAPPPPKAGSLGRMWREGAATLGDRNFLAMVASGLAGAAAAGTTTALWAYMQPYFWGFSSDQSSLILAAQLLSAVLAFVLLPLLTRGRDKKPILVGISVAALGVGSGPVLLKLLGWFPATGSDALFLTMVVAGVIQVMLVVMSSVLTGSMVADIVESRAVVTGRREEGLLFSVLSFIGKVATGVGVWAGGIMLALIDFPADTTAIAVAPEVVERLGWLYGPSLAVFYLLSILALLFYRLDRATHAANLATLKRMQASLP
ncbi:MAG: MFS transporter [Gammaproteobacteria bacterium]|nr:MFS transporter [Gammaproteobacteria bacterium]